CCSVTLRPLISSTYTVPSAIDPLSLHDALPISCGTAAKPFRHSSRHHLRPGHQQIIAGEASRHLKPRQRAPAKPEHYPRVAEDGEDGDRSGRHGFGNPLPPEVPDERDGAANRV